MIEIIEHSPQWVSNFEIVELSRQWVSKCRGCQHCPATSRGCTIPEDRLDWRGEPVVGNPEQCRYFEAKERAIEEQPWREIEDRLESAGLIEREIAA